LAQNIAASWRAHAGYFSRETNRAFAETGVLK